MNGFYQYYVWATLLCIGTTGSQKYYDDEGAYDPRQYPSDQYSNFQMVNPVYMQQQPNVVAPKPEQINLAEELQKLNSSYTWQQQWPTYSKRFGSVSAVSFDVAGNVVVFHRGSHVWNSATFSNNNIYTKQEDGPIAENTIVAFERTGSGRMLYEWGKDLFYMPHGLTIDQDSNVWITDVALHQVMKFPPQGAGGKAIMVLGSPFKPGSSDSKFCKPTAVAVMSNGDFFVADGYCNARIMKFSKDGQLILKWGQHTFQGAYNNVALPNSFAIPHALALAADLNLLCVADRENGRVLCFYAHNGTFHSQYHSPIIGNRLFGVAYTPIKGGQLYVVNGPEMTCSQNEVRGFVIDMQSKQVVSSFTPFTDISSQCLNPHDIIVTPDGSEVYVADLDPPKVFKFSTSSVPAPPAVVIINETRISKPTVTIDEPESTTDRNAALRAISSAPRGVAALVVVAFVIVFALCTFGLAVLVTRRRKRGCFLLGKKTRNRRHAWDFPSVKTESFKLGSLLERKRLTAEFKKLDQEASDDEPTASTDLLPSNAQFA